VEISYVIAVVLVFVVVAIITSPMRRGRAAGEAAHAGEVSPEREELEAARDAKYREIRDAELDHQTGKISDDDFAAVDSVLRSEAIEILRKLDRLRD
jgi:flagellar biosynthesis/type III secretory pathway M-ring protein FliF/YscJ